MSDSVLSPPSAIAPDLASLGFWAQPPAARIAAFAWLREHEPVSRQRAPESVLTIPGVQPTPFWAVTRHAHIREASRNPEAFASGGGILLDDLPQEMLDASQSFIATDGERHRTLRGLVSSGFTPRHVHRMQEGIEADVATIVDELGDVPKGDFIEHVAKRLPLMTFVRLLGVSDADRQMVLDGADAAVSYHDEQWLAGRDPFEVLAGALLTLHGVCHEYIAHRRAHPGDDLLSTLVHAEADGRRLSELEIAAFFALLAVAANDTTRHTTSHAMHALSTHPEQQALLVREFDTYAEGAIEEFVRWATPVIDMRRTTTRPVVLAGVEIPAGEKVVLFYESGNRDPAAFDAPERFSITRSPNRHLGFGGGGPHYCMGAALAKLQLRVLFGALLRSYPQLRVGEPRYVAGNFVNGIGALPMERGPRA